MRKVDFRKIQVENINGDMETVDVSKALGNALYPHGKTLEVVELARNIWKNGEVELTDGDVKTLQEYVPQMCSYIVSTAIINAIK
ncbi:MAG: hypothetical protein J6R57_03055 [Bacteroidales bacterium]|nr:hypothetical protein [Bacteroidales bacterium]